MAMGCPPGAFLTLFDSVSSQLARKMSKLSISDGLQHISSLKLVKNAYKLMVLWVLSGYNFQQIVTKKKPIWLPVFKMWCFAGWKYWILPILMQIQGYLWPIQGKYVLYHIYMPVHQPLGLHLTDLSKVVSWTGSTDTGCGRFAVTPLWVAQLPCHFVYRSPRCPITMICSHFSI